MIIDAIIKISLIALSTVILSTILSQTKKEYALFLRLAGVVAVCMAIIGSVSDKIMSFISKAQDLTDQSEIVSILIKGAVICIISGLVSELCKESGNSSLSQAIEICGRLVIIILSLPLVNAVIETAFSFVK